MMRLTFDNNSPVQRIERGALRITKTEGDSLAADDESVSTFLINTSPGPVRPFMIEAEQGAVRRHLDILLPNSDWRLLQVQAVAYQTQGACFGEKKALAVPSHVWRGHEPVPYFSMPRSMFVLLHEFGHSHDEKRLKELPGSTAARKASAFEMTTAYAQYFEFSYREIDDYEEYVVAGERNASDYALAVIERWREDGIDLEPGEQLRVLADFAQQNLRQYAEVLYRLRNNVQPHQEVDPSAYSF